MEQTIDALLREGMHQGVFRGVAPERDTPVFLLSIAYCFPTATARLDEWPREGWLLRVVDWFPDHWRSRPGG